MAGKEAERQEFRVPISLALGDRTIEVPLTIQVTFDELAGIVRRHLESGEEIQTALLECYADQVAPREKAAGTRAPQSRQRRAAPGPEARPEAEGEGQEEAPAPARSRRRARKAGEPAEGEARGHG